MFIQNIDSTLIQTQYKHTKMYKKNHMEFSMKFLNIFYHLRVLCYDFSIIPKIVNTPSLPNLNLRNQGYSASLTRLIKTTNLSNFI